MEYIVFRMIYNILNKIQFNLSINDWNKRMSLKTFINFLSISSFSICKLEGYKLNIKPHFCSISGKFLLIWKIMLKKKQLPIYHSSSVKKKESNRSGKSYEENNIFFTILSDKVKLEIKLNVSRSSISFLKLDLWNMQYLTAYPFLSISLCISLLIAIPSWIKAT